MKPLLKNIIRYTVFFAIAAVLFYFAFKGTDYQELIGHLKHAEYSWVLLSILMGYTAVISRGYRWLLLLEPMGYKARPWASIHAVSFGYMFNIFVPRGGELGRCGAMNRVEKIPVDKLFGTVILERVIDFIFLIITLITAFLLNINNFAKLFDTDIGVNQTPTEGSGGTIKYVVLGLGVLVFLLLLLFRKRIINHPRFEVVRNFWSGIKEGFASIKKLKRKKAFIAHTVYIWIMYFLMVYICFYSLPETSHLTISDGFFIMIAASLGIVIPAPGGMGSYHYLVTLAMVVLGIEKSIGLSFAFIVHTSQTLILLGAGLVGVVYFIFAKKAKTETLENG